MRFFVVCPPTVLGTHNAQSALLKAPCLQPLTSSCHRSLPPGALHLTPLLPAPIETTQPDGYR